MAKPVDIGGKRLVSLDPTAWARWLTDDSSIQAVEVISGEFQWVSRTNDALIKVQSASHGLFLMALELQVKAAIPTLHAGCGRMQHWRRNATASASTLW